MVRKKKWNPEEDGITHINVYSQGRTELGRLLSNFAHTPFTHEAYGNFECVEGFWYWIQCELPRFRYYLGAEAKSEGKLVTKYREHPTKEELRSVYLAKLQTYPDLALSLVFNQLPLAHYYVYGSKVVEPIEWQWTATLWEEIAEELRRKD